VRSFLYYIIWTIILGVIFYFGTMFHLNLKASMRYDANHIPYLLYVILFPIVVGMLLRLPKTIHVLRGNQRKSYDWIKLLAINIPIILFIFIPIINSTSEILPYFLIQPLMIVDNILLMTIAGIVFGYVILDCIKTKAV